MTIETLTINDLRAKTSNTAAIYYTTNKGKEGEWYYDAADTASLDNIGTILVSTNGMRFKRVYDAGFVTATWFFDNSYPDATLGIQRALDFISKTNDSSISNQALYGGGTVFLPKGIYITSDTLLIGQNCRLIGVNNRYHFEYRLSMDGGGTIIKAQFENPNKWIISSATLNIYNNTLLPFDITLSKFDDIVDENSYNFQNYIYRMGIAVENLTIDGSGNAFGAIRLSNAGNSVIRNVGAHNVKCGFMLNTCWGGSIENCFVYFLWYGALVIDCNSSLIINSYFAGRFITEAFIASEDLPNFIYNEDTYASWGLNDNVKFGKTGIYCLNTSSLSINSTVVEGCTNAITCSRSTTSLISVHIEDIKYYGIVVGIGDGTQLVANQIGISSIIAAFFFGNGVNANINTCGLYASNLYVYNEASNRNIVFTNTFNETLNLRGFRKYFADIIFTDEGYEGKNYGSVYVDPTDGHDDNYGFNINDAVQTFDAALIRVQNQSTINPLKVIYIKAAPIITESNPYSVGAAIKDISFKQIENVDILITSYGIDEQNPKGRILFIHDNIQYPTIGMVIFTGNVKLYFRDIDLFTKTTSSGWDEPSSLDYLSMFGLEGSYSKIIFDNMNIYLDSYYSIFRSLSPTKGSSIETKFLNTNVYANSSFVVPLPSLASFYSSSLIVDCVQINSTLSAIIYYQTNNGWNPGIIIRNNF